MSMKNAYDAIGNRTRDLPSQPIGPPLAPVMPYTGTNLLYKNVIFKGYKVATTGLMALALRNVGKL
jgi:hypothetical protein